jgi:trk system potassium uptake protein TrkA
MYVVINGGGKIGEYLATNLLDNRHSVAIIEQNEKRLDQLALILPSKALMILGDGCDSVYQADAGTGEADIFVATTGSDDVNLVSCEIANLVFGVKRTIARVNNPKNERIFRRMGIEAVSSTAVITRLIETEATEGAVHAVMSLTQGDLVLTEVTIPKAKHSTGSTSSSKEAEGEESGHRVADISLPEGSLLVAVGNGGSLEIVKGSTLLHPGDAVICVSKEGLEDKVRDVLLGL